MKRQKAKWAPSTQRDLYVRRYGPLAEFVMEFRKKHGRLPWDKAYENALARCTRPAEPKYRYYGGRGVKMKLARVDVMRLYLRDAAWRMKSPSIDRKNSNGDYTLRNCRFVEFNINRAFTRTQKTCDLISRRRKAFWRRKRLA